MTRRKGKYFKKVNCPICFDDNFTILFSSTLKPKDFNPVNIKDDLKNTLDDHKKHCRIVKCKSCSFVYTNPAELPQRLIEGYKNVVDNDYIYTELYRKMSLIRHLSKINNYKKRGNILDIGAFVGYFLELASEKGWNSFGIEPSVWAQDYGKNRGQKYIGVDIMSAKLKKDYFDVITMFDVIEHLPEPHSFIKIIRNTLKKGGILVIATPDIDSLFAKILGSNCPFLVRMHMMLYSRKTIKFLLEQYGFKIENISYYGRTFPISYLIDRLHVESKLMLGILSKIKRFKIISNIPLTINLRDSIFVIAKKI